MRLLRAMPTRAAVARDTPLSLAKAMSDPVVVTPPMAVARPMDVRRTPAGGEGQEGGTGRASARLSKIFHKSN